MINESIFTHKYTELQLLEMNTGLLAYIGDAVYELYVRGRTLENAARDIKSIHRETVSKVRAETQADAVKYISDKLTEAEKDLVRRARNGKMGTMAKHASVADYRYATGFECLIGYLYLKDDKDRLNEILTLVDGHIFENGEKDGLQ